MSSTELDVAERPGAGRMTVSPAGLSLLVLGRTPSIDESLRRWLRRNVAVAEFAETVDDAERLLPRCHFDCVVVAVDSAADPALAWIEALRRADSVPCICVAAPDEPSLTSASLRAGAAAVLPYPLDAKSLQRFLATQSRVPGRTPATAVRVGLAGRESARAAGRRQRPDPPRAVDGRARGAHAGHSADRRPDRHGQGVDRPAAPRAQRPSRTVRPGQLRRDPARVDGDRALRPRQGRVHRRAPAARRPLRRGAGRHPVPRRDQRDAQRPAGQAAARPRGEPHPAGRRRPRSARSTYASSLPRSPACASRCSNTGSARTCTTA